MLNFHSHGIPELVSSRRKSNLTASGKLRLREGKAFISGQRIMEEVSYLLTAYHFAHDNPLIIIISILWRGN